MSQKEAPRSGLVRAAEQGSITNAEGGQVAPAPMPEPARSRHFKTATRVVRVFAPCVRRTR